MAIPHNADFNQLMEWLNKNLLPENSFLPHEDSIPLLKSKGIYFWFLHPDGYKTLSNYVTIEPIEPKYTKNIDGIIYDLVYLGTTGTGKNGNSTLTKRLEWHICQKHTLSTIKQKQSALSTLRTGLGSLLSDDLILPNTEKLINNFMRTNMVIYYVEYPNINEVIDNDEKILIKNFKPLLNLKNNTNSHKSSATNSTKDYKFRRNIIQKNTKKRLGF
jgi:hypothetical protein